MTTTLQLTLMEQTIKEVQQLHIEFKHFRETMTSDIKEISEALIGGRFNKVGLVDRVAEVEKKNFFLEEQLKQLKANYVGAKWSMGIAASIGGVLVAFFEFFWKVVLKH